MDSKRVFVVEPTKRDREAYAQELREAGYSVVSSSTTKGFLRSDVGYRADCLSTELRFPQAGEGGFAFLQKVAKSVPTIVVSTDLGVRNAVAVMRSGAHHVFEKPVRVDTLLQSVELAVEKAAELREKACRRAEWTRRYATLTAREIEVMDLLIAGARPEGLKETLGIPEQTVVAHQGAIMHKLGVKNLATVYRAAMTREIPAAPAVASCGCPS